MLLRGFWISLVGMLLVGVGTAQCRIINHKFSSVYITYERVGKVSLQEEAPERGVILRLRNNSNCTVIVSIEQNGDFKFRRETVLPDLLFRYRMGESWQWITTGDAFLEIPVRGGLSVLFGVPFDRFDDEPNGLIEVPFEYEWEEKATRDGSAITVQHYAYFTSRDIPAEVISKYNAGTAKKYPAVWFAPINDPNKPDWEILPQEAKAGEVILSKRNELGILSNFAATPFELDGKRYASVEGFWQMMLYPEGPDDERAKDKRVIWKYTRDQVAQMTAIEAKQAGTLAEENMKNLGINWVTFEGERFPYRSAKPGRHYQLITEAMRAKLEQNPEVRRILLATGDLKLRPDHIEEPNAPPEWHYYEIWMQLRAERQKQ